MWARQPSGTVQLSTGMCEPGNPQVHLSTGTCEPGNHQVHPFTGTCEPGNHQVHLSTGTCEPGNPQVHLFTGTCEPGNHQVHLSTGTHEPGNPQGQPVHRYMWTRQPSGTPVHWYVWARQPSGTPVHCTCEPGNPQVHLSTVCVSQVTLRYTCPLVHVSQSIPVHSLSHRSRCSGSGPPQRAAPAPSCPCTGWQSSLLSSGNLLCAWYRASGNNAPHLHVTRCTAHKPTVSERTMSVPPYIKAINNNFNRQMQGSMGNNHPSTEQAVKTKPKQDKSFSFIFRRLSGV